MFYGRQMLAQKKKNDNRLFRQKYSIFTLTMMYHEVLGEYYIILLKNVVNSIK